MNVRSYWPVLPLLAIALFPTAAGASDPKTKDSKLSLDVLHRELRNDSPEREMRSSPLRPAQTFGLSPRESVTLEIYKQNPLVFSYKRNGTTQAETPDFTAAVAFAKGLQSLIDLKQFAKRQNSTTNFIKTYDLNVGDLFGFKTTYDASDVFDIKNADLEKILETSGLKPSVLADLEKAVLQVGDYVEGFPGLTVRTLQDGELDKVKTEVAGWQLSDQRKAIDTSYEVIRKTHAAVAKALATTATLLQQDAWVMTTIGLFEQDESNTRALLNSAGQFQSVMAAVGKPLPLGDPILFDASHISSTSVTVTVTDAGAAAIKAAHVDPAIGTFTFAFEPNHPPIGVSVGPGLVYVNTRQGPNDWVGAWRPAVMASFTKPESREYGTFFSVLVGVTPESDRVGGYLGLGINVLGAFSLSAGVTGQQVTVGDSHPYKPGFFLSATIDMVKK